MGIQGYTTEELAILTPDERAALEAEAGENEEEIAAIAGEPEDGGEQPAGEGTQANDGTPGDGDGKGTAKPNEEDEGTTAKKGDSVGEDDDPFMLEVPADAEERRKSLTTERDEAFSKLMEGTIDTAEYNAINNRVTSELEAIASAVSKAELSQAMRAHEVKKEWNRTVTAFFTEAKAEGADYLAQPDLHKEFDGLVKIFAAEASAKGMSDVGLKASKYALEQAQVVMRARHGFKPAEKVDPSAQNQPTDAEKAIAAANAVRHSLKTLTNIPAADKVMTDDSPLAKIATLQGEELEIYMASLSPADVRRLEAASDQ